MVESIRRVEKAMGDIVYPTDTKTIKGREFCRSLYVAADLKAGDIITEENVRSVRPGFGLHPKYLAGLLGKRMTRDARKGDRFDLSMVS